MTLDEIVKKLESLASQLRDNASGMSDCCHGDEAGDALEEAADELDALARTVHLDSVDVERTAARQ
jgi:hypothetical protein